MVSSNSLSFKINDGDAMQCQRDLTDKYRVTIMADSRFELEGQQLDIGADLSHFPRPFFDSMQMTPAAIAMAFPAKLSSDTQRQCADLIVDGDSGRLPRRVVCRYHDACRKRTAS
jgi:hypothetical protein